MVIFWVLFLPFLVATFHSHVTAEPKSYTGYQVLSIYPKTESEIQAVNSLGNDHELDFWRTTASVGGVMTVLVPPTLIADVTGVLHHLSVLYEVTSTDVGKKVTEERQRLLRRTSQNRPFDPNDFNTLADIEAQLQVYLADCPANFSCSLEDIRGQSSEGRYIKRFSITQGSGRQAYWIDSNIHASEWLSSATNLRIIDNFVYNYTGDPDATRLLDTYDWHFVPIMNPDGYEYTWTDDRYWRKSRTVHSTSNCTGVDLNRNYNVNWGASGTDTDPCSNYYGGEGPASTLETQALQSEIDRLAPTLEALISMHVFGQYFLHPYGHDDSNGTCVTAPDHDNLFAAASDMAAAIFATNGQVWQPGPICSTLYPASGNTIDYAYKDGTGVRYTFTPELRGTSAVIDPINIQPSFEEMWAALVALEGYVSAN